MSLPDAGATSDPPDAAAGRVRRENELLTALVQLAEVSAEQDLEHYLQPLIEVAMRITSASACLVTMRDAAGLHQVAATSSAAARSCGLVQRTSGRGPSILAFTSGTPVALSDLASSPAENWPEFTRTAAEVDVHSVLALPLRHRHNTIGALTLLGSSCARFDRVGLQPLQALAAMATIAVLRRRMIEGAATTARHLTVALDRRPELEQAKGVLSVRAGISVEEALDRIRLRSRSTNTPIQQIANTIISNAIQEPVPDHLGAPEQTPQCQRAQDPPPS